MQRLREPPDAAALQSHRRYGYQSHRSAGGAVRAGNLLFVGGIGGWYPEESGNKPARPVAGDIAEQTTDAVRQQSFAFTSFPSVSSPFLAVPLSVSLP